LLTAEDISEFLQKCHFALRKPLFYPLNYGERSECKSKKEEGRSPEIKDQKDEGKIQRSDFRGLKSRENKL
jgi:hypothetical protein